MRMKASSCDATNGVALMQVQCDTRECDCAIIISVRGNVDLTCCGCSYICDTNSRMHEIWGNHNNVKG
jgi:hypothetical protein